MTEKLRNNKAAGCMVVCGVLMALLLIWQFTPFWHYGEAGESCSISGYVWFPSDQKTLETWLGSQAEGHDLNSFVGMPILIMLLSAAGTVCCLIAPHKGAVPLLPAACGLAGVIGYLTTPALKLGTGWAWHLLICIVLLLLSGYSLIEWVKKLRA